MFQKRSFKLKKYDYKHSWNVDAHAKNLDFKCIIWSNTVELNILMLNASYKFLEIMPLDPALLALLEDDELDYVLLNEVLEAR